jgi:hypothetical protein
MPLIDQQPSSISSSTCTFYVLQRSPHHSPLTYNSFLVSLPLTPLMVTSGASSCCLRAEWSLRISTGETLVPFSKSAAHKAAPTWLVTVDQHPHHLIPLDVQVKMMETTGTRPRTIEMVPNLVVSFERTDTLR